MNAPASKTSKIVEVEALDFIGIGLARNMDLPRNCAVPLTAYYALTAT